MPHKFRTPAFDRHQTFATVYCLFCGEEAKQYKYGGYINYSDGKGGWTRIPTKCKHDEKKPKPTYVPPSTQLTFGDGKPVNVSNEDVEEESKKTTDVRGHKFDRKEINPGEAFVVEKCECGARSLRYPDGKRLISGDSKTVCPLTDNVSSITESTRHKFEKKEIGPGENSTIEYCIKCGLKSKRYANNGRVYYLNGKQASKVPVCAKISTISEELCVKDNDISEKTEVTHESVTAISEIEEKIETLTTKQEKEEIGSKNEFESKLFDSYVIIKLMYEDMVRAGIDSKSRRMAGRLLYSNGFEDFIKSIEK